LSKLSDWAFSAFSASQLKLSRKPSTDYTQRKISEEISYDFDIYKKKESIEVCFFE